MSYGVDCRVFCSLFEAGLVWKENWFAGKGWKVIVLAFVQQLRVIS